MPNKDMHLLFSTRIIRLFAYGSLSVILVLYLEQLGLGNTAIGLLLSLTLIGDTVISLWITTTADRRGRRRMLIFGAALMILAGVLFTTTQSFVVLLVAATIGVISPSGNEVGPFLSIEQAALSHILPDTQRTHVFAWYNLVGSFATAFGAFAAGTLSQFLQNRGVMPLESYRVVILTYAAMGVLLAVLFTRLSPGVEVTPLRRAKATSGGASENTGRSLWGLRGSHSIVFKLSALFSLDAFAGGFVLQSIVAYWFYKRFNVQPALLGSIFMGANLLAGISSLLAVRVAARIGLVRTMVFTHIPSNILLILVPLMPNLPLAITVLLLRFSISQMDVPTRQSYTMAVVQPDERSAAAGITGIARTLGAAVAPVLAGPLLAGAASMNLIFFLSGGLKIIYDLVLYRSFQAVRPPEERQEAA